MNHMQRMFIDRKNQAKKRITQFTVAAAIMFVFLFALVLVVILLYGEREIVEGDMGNIHISDLNVDLPSLESPPQADTPSPLPVQRADMSVIFDSTPIRDAENIEEPEPSVPAQEEDANSGISEPVLVPAPEYEPTVSVEVPPPEEHPPEDPSPAEQPPLETSESIAARQFCQEILIASQNWWQEVSTTPELSDSMVLSSFIANFNLPGSVISTFEVTATNIEIQGVYNDGNFIITLVFSSENPGIYFVAWYGSGSGYAAAWQSGINEVKAIACNGVRPENVISLIE